MEESGEYDPDPFYLCRLETAWESQDDLSDNDIAIIYRAIQVLQAFYKVEYMAFILPEDIPAAEEPNPMTSRLNRFFSKLQIRYLFALTYQSHKLGIWTRADFEKWRSEHFPNTQKYYKEHCIASIIDLLPLGDCSCAYTGNCIKCLLRSQIESYEGMAEEAKAEMKNAEIRAMDTEARRRTAETRAMYAERDNRALQETNKNLQATNKDLQETIKKLQARLTNSEATAPPANASVNKRRVDPEATAQATKAPRSSQARAPNIKVTDDVQDKKMLGQASEGLGRKRKLEGSAQHDGEDFESHHDERNRKQMKSTHRQEDVSGTFLTREISNGPGLAEAVRGWTRAEKDALITCMGRHRDEVAAGEAVQLYDTSLYRLMSDRMSTTYKMNRSHGAVKNIWSRELRKVANWDERKVPGGQLVTSAQNKKN